MGLAQFFDRVVSPTNGLGQLGQAFLAASGGPIGQAFSSLASQAGDREERGLRRQLLQQQLTQRQQPHYERLGDDLLVLNPDGTEQRRIPGAPRQSERDRQWIAAGLEPGTEQWRRAARRAVELQLNPSIPVRGVNESGAPTLEFVNRDGFNLDDNGAGSAPIMPDPPMPTDSIPVVDSPEQAASLAPGTMFRTRDGRRLRVPGGQGATPANFPGQGQW